MIRLGLAYGLLSTRRRMRSLVLPIVTTATGAFLLVQVLALTNSVRAQAETFGDGSEIYRATILIAVVVLLVGVVEVAVCTTRTINHRMREIGVLGATGVPRPPVVAALLVEAVIASVVGAVVGSVVAVIVTVGMSVTNLSSANPSAGGTALGVVLAIVTSAVAAVLTSAIPSWRAASRPPIRSLSYGG
jgi:ABC-type antimicrobial peptide transport system permease subunit